ncbi:MAP2 [Enterospora canceri]|uniref:MAP2 n=1 Tax=Enterospora canceri TaxID=1081671 RepID=A0A1Y1S7Y5_9MICR|nr:MAP2 [Enterospora canceri]
MLLVNETEEAEIKFVEQINDTGDSVLDDALRAAEAHRRIRYNIQKMLKPGCSLKKVIQYVEESTRTMLKGERNNGIGFPCGISLNHVAAHFSLNPWNPDILLGEKDVLKVDFGTHVNGRIIDSAFTVCYDERYEKLLEASRAATERGIRVAGVDAAVCEIGREISEVMRSFELEEGNKVIQIKPVWNLNGHSIGQYRIHGGVSIPQHNNGDCTRIKEGFIAIETFATTGRGEVSDFGESSHFMLGKESGKKIYSKKNEDVLKMIRKEVGTLPFSHQHLDHFAKDTRTAVQLLAARKFVDPYPPLVDITGCKVAQFEHTVYVTERGKTVVSKGADW